MEYFLSDIHEDETNPDNPLGSKGVITAAFADLVEYEFEIKVIVVSINWYIIRLNSKVWCEKDKVLTPTLFRNAVQ